MLVDGFGRVGRDLRVSLTDRCNLRCSYCMPVEGLPWLPQPEILTDDEVVRLVRVAVSLGITAVRFTGGEPLLRPGLVNIVRAVSALGEAPRLSVTTNGIGLAELAPDLHAAGLERINISLDTLKPEVFKAISHRDRLDDVLAGLDAAQRAGLRPVKVNAVLLRGINDTEAADLLEYCLARDFDLRFIEQMPLDPQHGWRREQMITAEEILDQLRRRWTIEPDNNELRGSAPAELFVIDGGPARVGIIASVTKPFCADCDRVRLTADGALRTCLFAQSETDLRTQLRAGATDAELAATFRRAMLGKKAGHGIGEPDFDQPARPMSAIGG
jgi:cyclic pyranopterin phosphate synthase